LKQAAEYRQHAADCRRLAATAKTDAERDALVHMASVWEKLAQDREEALARPTEQDGRNGRRMLVLRSLAERLAGRAVLAELGHKLKGRKVPQRTVLVDDCDELVLSNHLALKHELPSAFATWRGVGAKIRLLEVVQHVLNRDRLGRRQTVDGPTPIEVFLD
jgi:hypothetical protein